MTKESVWVSRAMQDSRLFKNGTSNSWENERDKARDTIERAKNGEPLPSDAFPTECYNDIEGRHVTNLPPLFEFAALWMVTGEMAEVLRQFELGKTSLYPVELYQRNRRTRVPGEYFILNIGETKCTLDVERSQEGIKKEAPSLPWQLKSTIADDEVVLSNDAPEGPDLWFEDVMWQAIFFNGAVFKALRAAKLTRRLPLRRCRILD